MLNAVAVASVVRNDGVPSLAPELPALSPAAAAAIDVEPAELVQRWLASLSPTARRSYRRNLAAFASWALAPGADPVSALRLLCSLDVGRAGELVRRWRDELLATGRASGTVGGSVTALCSLVSACRRAGLVSWSLEGCHPRVEQRHDRSGPRRADVERIVACIDDAAAAGEPKAIRDSALVRLLYTCALRRSEVTGLRVHDLQHGDAGPILMVRRKGHKERKPVAITQRCVEAINRWLALRGSMLPEVATGGGLMFLAIRDADPSRALNGESIRKLVASWARRAGVKAPCRPHGLRHSAATTCAKRGSLAELMALGGWSSLAAARRYLDNHQEDRAAALRHVEIRAFARARARTVPLTGPLRDPAGDSGRR